MDLKTLKQKALELKQKAIELKDKTIEKAAEKVSESSLVIKSSIELQQFIDKSENKNFVTKEWVEKTFTRRTIVIFWDSKKDFFKEFLVSLPILFTKSFSQNIDLKVVDVNNENVDINKYELKEIPALCVFENKELIKVIIWEDNIKKVVKSLTLDINKTIEEL